jgi:hypothetical protein
MALIEIGGFWTVGGRVLLPPPIRTLAAPLYGFTARYRHRLAGGSATCYIYDGAQGNVKRR